MLRELRLCEVLCIAGMIAGCNVDSGAPLAEARSDGVVQATSPPELGPGAYALPLVVGWQTGTISHSFDVNSNTLAIGGGGTGSGGSGGYWFMPVPIEAGQRIATAGLVVRDTAGAPVLAYIDVKDSLSGGVSTWCQGASAGSGLQHSFAFACAGGPMPPSAQLVVRITPQGQTATIHGVWIDPAGQGRTRPVWPVVRFGASSQSEAADPVAGGGRTPVRRFNTGASVYAEIPFEEGSTITGFSMELVGDGAVDGSLEILYGTRGGGQFQIGLLTSFTNVPASWGTYQTSAFLPTKLAGNGQLSLVLTANAQNLYWGYVWPVFSKL